MTYKELKLQAKEELKVLAEAIKNLKSKRSSSNSGYVYGLWAKKDEYRHKHIAYCEFFNFTPYEQIEQPRADNKPRRHRIDTYKKQWVQDLDWKAILMKLFVIVRNKYFRSLSWELNKKEIINELRNIK